MTQVDITAKYKIDIPQKYIDYMKKHITDKSEDRIAQDLAKAFIEAGKEIPYAMEARD